MMRLALLLALGVIAAVAPVRVAAQGVPVVVLDGAVAGDGLALPAVWAFTPAADTAGAAWEGVDARLPAGLPLPAGWEGSGWFRIRLAVDSTLAGRPLGLQVRPHGAAAVYLDGGLLHAYGLPSADAAEEVVDARPHVVPVVFAEAGPHVLSVRYSSHAAADLHAVGYDAGFTAHLGDAAAMMGERAATIRSATQLQFGLTGLYLVFGLIHFFLFAFYPRRRENLFFALVACCIGLVLFNNFQEALFFRTPGELVFIRRLWAPLALFTVLIFLRLVYAVYGAPVPRSFWALAAGGLALGAWGWIDPTLGWAAPAGGRTYAYAWALVVEAEIVRVALARGLRNGRPDVFALGVVAQVVAFSYPLLVVTGLMPPVVDLLLFPNVVILGWLLSTSLYLSRGFARTNATLERKLEEVTRLSEEKLAQERRLQQQEVERARLQAEYDQKLRELEEARQLQLSLLPEKVPAHPEVELAAYMQTATEVGGDYYDFRAGDDGTLTLAVGDATGHGMKAGTMVIATKSLFNLLGREDSLLGILGRATRAIKLLNMRTLFMALTLARYHRGRLRLATAGMPPTLVYRAATGEVDVVRIKGMPLGSFVEFPYTDAEIALAAGDTVLFMSDGFPELFNEDGEMLGYDEAAEVFAAVADRDPQAIIDHLVDTGRAWRNTRPLDDDMTFVVLKMSNVERRVSNG